MCEVSHQAPKWNSTNISQTLPSIKTNGLGFRPENRWLEDKAFWVSACFQGRLLLWRVAKSPQPREPAPDSKLLAGRHTADCRQHWPKPAQRWPKIHTTILRRLKVGWWFRNPARKPLEVGNLVYSPLIYKICQLFIHPNDSKRCIFKLCCF